MTLNVGINACRARSGGAIAHLVGILKEDMDPRKFGIDKVHVWSYGQLLATLPEAPWLVKHGPPELERSLLQQLWWERFLLPGELENSNCAIVLNVDAGSVCRFRPSVTMSRDMLSYEPGEIKRYGLTKARLRLIALRYVQNAALRSADGVIFLTHYAARVIQKSCGPLRNIAYVSHGVGAAFQTIERGRHPVWSGPIRCLYVSNAMPYKHQWHVVEAIAQLRLRGHDLQLELVGGGEGRAQKHLQAKINEVDPERRFVKQYDFLPQDALPNFMAEADLFVFASSCENMPNTLVEGMAAGLPIACSNRGPMPEVLEDGGVYFDPEDPDSIAVAIADLVANPDKRVVLAARAKQLAQQYSWERCSRETFSFIAQTAAQTRQASEYC